MRTPRDYDRSRDHHHCPAAAAARRRRLPATGPAARRIRRGWRSPVPPPRPRPPPPLESRRHPLLPEIPAAPALRYAPRRSGTRHNTVPASPDPVGQLGERPLFGIDQRPDLFRILHAAHSPLVAKEPTG